MTLSWDELEQIKGRQTWRIPIPPTCPHCDYMLTGLKTQRCPECGTDFNWNDVRRRAGQIWSIVNLLSHANRDAKVGLKAAVFGWVIMVPMVFLKTGWIGCVPCTIAGIAGLVGIVLGSQSFRIRRVPAWARQYISGDPPQIWIGAAAVLLSIALEIVGLLVWS